MVYINPMQGLLVFITGAFLILAHCADKHGSTNFQEVVREVLGPGAYIVVQVVVLLYMFGSSIAYMILIGDQLEKGKPKNTLLFKHKLFHINCHDKIC